MSITEIPRAFLYKCDVCGISGYYTNSRPDYWATLKVDGTIERLLCDACREEAIKVINEWAARKMKV